MDVGGWPAAIRVVIWHRQLTICLQVSRRDYVLPAEESAIPCNSEEGRRP
jgi:hypothetical protein